MMFYHIISTVMFLAALAVCLNWYTPTASDLASMMAAGVFWVCCNGLVRILGRK